VVYWRCSIRMKLLIGRATVTQRGDTFSAGRAHHNHPPQEGCRGLAEIVVKVIGIKTRLYPILKKIILIVKLL